MEDCLMEAKHAALTALRRGFAGTPKTAQGQQLAHAQVICTLTHEQQYVTH